MKHTSDVLIIGGGVTGCAAAYYLSTLGIKTTIVERSGVASQASGYAAGGLNPLEGYEIPGLLSDFAMVSYLLHLALWEPLQEKTGINYYGRILDLLKVAYDESGLQALEKSRQIFEDAGEHGFKVEKLSASGLFAMEPKLSREIVGGLHIYGNAGVDSYKFTSALCEAARQNGSTAIIGTVESFVTDGDRVTGVKVNGDDISCNTVVVSTGPWSTDISNWLNLSIPVQPLKGEILRLKLKNGTVQHDVADGFGSIYPKPDGLAWVGATEERKGFDTELSEEARTSLWTNGAKMIPELTDAELVLQTACLRPVTPDWMPIVGAAPGWANVFLNTGAGKKGILFGPAMGQATADLITKGESSIDVSKFCADRFEQIGVAD